MSYIDIRIHFDEVVKKNYTWYKWNRAELEWTDIARDDRNLIAEHLAQSDFGWIELPTEIIEAIGAELIDTGVNYV